MKKPTLILAVVAFGAGAPALAHAALQAAQTPRVNSCPISIPTLNPDQYVVTPCIASHAAS